jgi:hypothetical protein
VTPGYYPEHEGIDNTLARTDTGVGDEVENAHYWSVSTGSGSPVGNPPLDEEHRWLTLRTVFRATMF